MESRKCKNNKCKKPLPGGYKHNYCEKCRNDFVKQVKIVGKTFLGCVALVGSTAIAVATKGSIHPKK